MDELIATAISAIVVAVIGGIIGLLVHSLINDYLNELKKAMKEKECTCPIFRALEKKGLRWNPETEEIEVNKEQRWRAKEGEHYYFVGNVFGISSHREAFDEADDGLWNSGNYFSTENEAQKYTNEFKRMLQERTLDKEE